VGQSSRRTTYKSQIHLKAKLEKFRQVTETYEPLGLDKRRTSLNARGQRGERKGKPNKKAGVKDEQGLS